MLHTIFKSITAFAFVAMTAAVTLAADFDNDGKADFAVFRPTSTTWYCEPSSAAKGEANVFQWGHSTDVLVPADYDGDGRTDLAVWRPENGVWYIHQSGGGVLLVKWGMTTIHPTGGLADVPVPADFDGDGETDLGVWRPDTGEWWILKSSNGYNQDQPMMFRWGKLGDVPVQADYDGDNRADFAVFRTTENRWYIFESATSKSSVQMFGIAGMDKLVPADYNGDGKTDIAVYRGGVWYVLDRQTGEMDTFHFGFSDDVPVPADYDGDGSTDYAVYRSGTWYVSDSSSPRLRTFNFGLAGDIPVGAGVVRESIVAVP